MKKILIFSDSHSQNNIMLKIISEEKPNLVLHAGDYCFNFNEISKFIDYFCKGNNDFESNEGLNGKEVVRFEYEGFKFLITHSDKELNFNNSRDIKEKLLKKYGMENINIFIYGHSHIEDVDRIHNTLFINPGSISLPRNSNKSRSYAILLLENRKIISYLEKDIIKYYNENN